MIALAIYAFFCLWLAVATWKHPGASVAAVLCMYGLEQWAQASHPFFVQYQSFTNFLLVGLVVVAIGLRIVRTGTLFEDYPRQGVIVLLLYGYAFISTQWSPRVDISLKVWMHYWPYVIAFVVLVPLAIRDLKDLHSLFAKLLVIGSFIVALLLFYSKWETRRIVLGEGFHGNPLAVAQLAGMVGLTAVAADQLLSPVRIWRLIKWVILAVCLVLVVRSGSRGQLLSLLMFVGLVWTLTRPSLNIQTLIMAMLACVFLGAILSQTLETYWTYDTYSTESRWEGKAMGREMLFRIEQTKILLTHWFREPGTLFFGLGNSASFDPKIIGFYPHIVVFEILAEEGLVGIALFLFIMYYSVRSAAGSLQMTPRGSVERACISILVAMFAFTFVLSFKQGSLLATPEMFMFAIILGKVESHLQRTVDEMSLPIEDESDEQREWVALGYIGHTQ
jgi:hypothetical protein